MMVVTKEVAMGWLIAAVVVVVGALVWWSSGRAMPLGRRVGNPNDDPGHDAGRPDGRNTWTIPR